jgi:hypothetical protein
MNRRHSVTVMTTSDVYFPGASHRATCSTCGWRGDSFYERDEADTEARHHCETAQPVALGAATQAGTDADGHAAERRHRAARATSAARARAAALTRARGRIEAALGDPEHQAALDAEIERHLAACQPAHDKGSA